MQHAVDTDAGAKAAEPEPTKAGPADAGVSLQSAWTPGVLLRLQGAVGNRAISKMLARQSAAPAAPAAAPPALPPRVSAGAAGGSLGSKIDAELEASRRQMEQGAGDAAEKPQSKEEALAKVDRAGLAQKRGELGAVAKAETPDPKANHGAVASAAAGVKAAAEAGPHAANQPKGGAAPAKGGGPGGALEAAGAAAALAEQAYADAERGPEPDVPAPLTLPEPVAPVDAGGAPLPPIAGGDAPVLAIAARAQALREQGHALRAQAAGERGNAAIIRGNIAQAQAGVVQAEGAITSSKEGLEHRRTVTGQAKTALGQSEEKAAMVAEKAPELSSKAEEQKADSGPMAGEAGELSGKAASADADDAEANAKAKESSGQLGKVGSDIGSVDQTFGQSGERAKGFAAEAAQAQAANTQTAGKIQETEAAIQQTDARLGELGGQNTTAKGQLAAYQSQPAQLETQADAIDKQGQGLIEASQAIGDRLAAAQTKHVAEMAAVPAVAPPEASAGGAGGTLARQEMAYDQRWNVNIAGLATQELPEVVTGADRPADIDRQQRLDAERKRKTDELTEINAMCDGHFENASAGDKALMSLRLTGRHLWNGVGETKWPQFVGHLARGLIDPRVSLMGIVSGLSMALSGAANLFNMAAWKADPLGNLLKSAADIATGITIILGSIVGLATAIIAIMWALAIVTFGFLGPAAAAVTPICTTIITTLFPWSIIAAKWALALQALCFIKNLAEAATSKTASDLQTNADQMTEDAKQGGAMAATIVVAKGMEVGGRALANTQFGQRVAGGVQSVGERFNILPPAGAAVPPAGGAGAAVEPPVAPVEAPSAVPTEAPTAVPTEAPTAVPTEAPTAVPTEAPTAVPTEAPTAVPTEAPTAVPTEAPTAVPTEAPTAVPTEAPPASTPTEAPTPTTEPPSPPPSDVPAGGGPNEPGLPPDFEVPEDFTFTTEGPQVQVPVDPTGAPARVLEIGAGPTDTNLGLPMEPGQGNPAVHDPSLVDVTRTDIQPRPGVTELNATEPIPPGLQGQDAVIINNPRGYQVDIATVGEAVRPGGRIVIQGRAEVVPGMRGINPDMNPILQQAIGGELPPGYRVVEVVTLPEVPSGNPAVMPKPPDVMGGPFQRTTGGPVSWPNTRIVIERIPEGG